MRILSSFFFAAISSLAPIHANAIEEPKPYLPLERNPNIKQQISEGRDTKFMDSVKKALYKTIPAIDSFLANDDVDQHVVGGKEVRPPRRYEYIASLQFDGFGHVCGGVLIEPGWVLSAAHCGGVATSIHLGRHNLMDDCEEYEVFDVGLEIIHEDFNDWTLENDIMLIKLVGESSFQPVQLDNGEESSLTKDEAEATVIGWGATNNLGRYPDKLQEVCIDVVEADKCNAEDRWNGTVIDEIMICAAAPRKGACYGDSGGPLIHKAKNDDAASDILLGIVSFGYICGCELFPSGYARVSSYYDWINLNKVTPAPTISAVPTSSPTSCPSETLGVSVVIKVDNWPGETAWMLKANGTILDGVLYGDYEKPFETYNHFKCAPLNSIFEFTIQDKYGNGLQYNGNGFYEVYLDGELKVFGGSEPFGTSLTEIFA